MQGWIVASDSVRDQDLVVPNLRPDTSYMFLVRAQNSHGLSLPSQVAGPFRTRGRIHTHLYILITSLDVSFCKL